MNINNVIKILDFLCPFSLAKFEHNGFLVNCQKKKIDRIAFTLGLSHESLKKAIKKKTDLLIVHNSPETLIGKGEYYDSLGLLAQKNNVGIFRLHLPLDFATKGIIYQLCKMMNFNAKPIKLFYEGSTIYGGVYVSNEMTYLKAVIKKVEQINPATLRIVNPQKKLFQKIAITSGDGCKPEFLFQIKPDVFICGLLNQEAIRIAKDLDITLIEATSYATENEPLKSFVKYHGKDFLDSEVYFIDVKNDVLSYNRS